MREASEASLLDRPGWAMGISVFWLICVWQIIVWATAAPPYILPGPLAVLEAMVENNRLILFHAWITALEVVVGLVIGTLLGMLTAVLLIASPFARKLLVPMLVLSQTIPVFAIAPLLTLWLGYGLSSKIAMTLLIIYFPVASTFFDGLKQTPTGYLDLARTMGAGKWATLCRVRIPAALPSLSSGIRLAAVYAPIGAVIGEWVGASQGLGYLMLLANGRVKTALMFAALIALCLLTVMLRGVIGMLCDRLTAWSGVTATR